MQEAARLISNEAARLYDAMHGLIPRLSPVTLDTMGLAGTLESLVRDLQKRHAAVTLSLRHEVRVELGPSVALAAYRFAQEGLINALRHAHASRIEVELCADAHRILMTVKDDGTGLTGEWARPGHFGLRGLKDRIEHLGGRFAVVNREQGGMALEADIPLEAPEST